MSDASAFLRYGPCGLKSPHHEILLYRFQRCSAARAHATRWRSAHDGKGLAALLSWCAQTHATRAMRYTHRTRGLSQERQTLIEALPRIRGSVFLTSKFVPNVVQAKISDNNHRRL